MKNLLNKVGTIEFRQTLNMFSKNWSTPKKLTEDGKWITIDNLDRVVDKKHGYGMAIWRLERAMAKVMDSENRYIWRCTKVTKSRKTVGKNEYGIYHFICNRRKYDISGAGIV